MPTERNCRFCNRIMEGRARRCPACGKRQGYWVEAGIAVAVLAIGLLIWSTQGWGLEITFWKNKETHMVLINPPSKTPDTPKQAPPPPPAPVVAQTVTPMPVADPPLAQPPPPPPSLVVTTEAISNSLPDDGRLHYADTAFIDEQDDYPFHVAESRVDPNTRTRLFYRMGMNGKEIRNPEPDARRYILSEYQGDYPDPQSGCGPTAILDWLIWYENFGLVPRLNRTSDLNAYKHATFNQIDQKITEVKGQSRASNGTNLLEMVVVFDSIIQELSQGRTRLDFQIKQAPLHLRDFLNMTSDYRAGILVVQPQDPITKQLEKLHAVAVISADTDGVIATANWGQYWIGELVLRSDGQWLVSRDPSHQDMKIVALLTLTPFTPANANGAK